MNFYRYFLLSFLSVGWCGNSFTTEPEKPFFCQDGQRPRGSDTINFLNQCNQNVSKSPDLKFSDKEILVHVCRQLRQLCVDSTGDEPIVYQALIDKARELVGADDEYRAKAHTLTAFLFGYPGFKKGLLITSSCVLGYGLGWLTFGD